VVLGAAREKKVASGLKDDLGVYVPVRESPHTVDGVGVSYGPRPEIDTPASKLFKAVAEINAFITAKAEPYRQIVPEYKLVFAGESCGFAASGLYYYHNKGEAAAETDALPPIRLPYDPLEVDKALYAASLKETRSSVDTKLRPKMSETAYVNRLYRLFLAEFAAVLQKERNTDIRSKLVTIIRKTKFRVPSSVAAMRDQILALLKGHPTDLTAIKDILIKAYSGRAEVSAALEATIAGTSFDFDHTTLHRLRSLDSHDKVAAAVADLMRPLVEIVDKVFEKAPAPDNIFVSCTVNTSVVRPQCFGGKLIVPSEKFGPLVDILAADIKNRYKAATLSSAIAGCFDETRFIERPGESLVMLE
jgi:hypothetical protein